MMNAEAEGAARRIRVLSKKELQTVKKHAALLAAVLAAGLASLAFGAQQPSPQPAVPQTAVKMSAYAPAERIPNLDHLKAEVRQYHECTCKCGCYARDLDRQADQAIAFLRTRAAHRRPDEKLALVLDIDETTLSNYEEMNKADFAYDSNVFNAWVNSGKAPAIPGTLRLYTEAQRLGVSVIFITGRPDQQRAVTERNLHTQGFQDWQQLILRPAAQASATALVYKSAERAAIAAEGYRIVLNVGDQWSDLKGTPEAEFSVKYPDPYYFIQ
jgi:acid phosphatase